MKAELCVARWRGETANEAAGPGNRDDEKAGEKERAHGRGLALGQNHCF